MNSKKQITMVVFLSLVIIFLMSVMRIKAEDSEGLHIYPTVCIEWNMETNHLYTLWVADNLYSNWYKHPYCTDYTPTSNRKGKMWRGEDQDVGFFKLEIDNITGPVYPIENTTNYVLVYTNSIPPPPDPIP